MSPDWSFILICVRVGIIPASLMGIILLFLVMPKLIRLLIFTTLTVYWGYIFNQMTIAWPPEYELTLTPAQLWFRLGLLGTLPIIFGLLLLPFAVEVIDPKQPRLIYPISWWGE